MKFPKRALSNVKYSPKSGVFEIGRAKKTRALTVATIKSFTSENHEVERIHVWYPPRDRLRLGLYRILGPK